MKTKRTAEDLSAKRLLRRTLPAALVLLAVVLAFTAPAAADTSWYSDSSITFTLTTADQLAGLASLVNSGNTFEGKTVELGGDISISGDWTPIGNATATPFSGTFDGNGHVVSLSVTVDETTGGSASIPYGLFGANNGTIQNLGVAGSFEITSNNRVSCFGSIAGENQKNGVITNCFSSCYVSLTNSGVNSVIVGGIVGQNMGMLENSYAVGDVTATASGTYSYAGGIAGYNYHTILNCYAAGNVTVESSSTSSHAGGIAGICRPDTNNVDGKGNITNCFALNEKITAAKAGRITGATEQRFNNYASPKLSGNSAWDGMTLNGEAVTGGTATNLNGTDVASDAVWGKTFEPFTDTTGWKLNEGNENFQLPVLKNIAVPADVDASHLKPAAVPTPEPTPESYFSGGDGTEGTPYLIASLSDLKNLSTLVNAGNAEYNASHYMLTAPVTLGNDWTPIGNTTAKAFKGTFDGNDQTITFSLSVNEIESADSNKPYGLFGANSGTIQNLGVAGSVTISSSDNVYFGSIAGYNQGDGVITDCFSSCDVSLTISGSGLDPNVGGIVGRNEGTLKNSYAVGDVMVTVPSGSCVGGIVGYNYKTIFNCYAAGNVTATDASSVGVGVAGGIAGYNSALTSPRIGNITNCFALNEKITAASAGRIAGYQYGSMVSPKFSGNSAWDGMTLNDATVTGGTATDLNGADVASETVWGILFEPFTDANGWKLNEGNENFQLPVLKNIAVPADVDASHLKPAAVPTPEPTPESYFSGGDGTEGTPYLIASLSDLKNLSTLVNAGNAEYNASHYMLTAPVTLGNDWTPIGNTTAKAFKGTFDGNDQTITFYNVVIENYADSFYGVFGVVGENGEVTNLNVAGSLTTSSLNEDDYDVGGIAGDNYGTITNSQSSVAVTVESTVKEVFAGGIAGYNTGTISGCSATGAVTADSTQKSYAGGIVGENDGTISGCSATGAVTADGTGESRAGGIAGVNTVTISGCSATGDVTADGTGESLAGGIAGDNYGGTITDSYATGAVTAQGTGDSYAGGIAGYNYGTVTNSQSSVAVTVESTGVGTQVSAGGIVGWNEGTISDCSATGAVTAESPTIAYAGGIAGFNCGLSITDCSASGDVMANGVTETYAGGIVGQIDAGTISNSYATGAVTAESSSYIAYAGGIAGYVPNDGITISNSYATGAVTAQGTGESYAGGIAGYSEGTITNSYALNSEVNSPAGTGKYVGRVAGHFDATIGGTVTNSFGWNGMTITVNGTNTVAGTDITSEAVWNKLFGPFTDTNVWMVNEGNDNFLLPVLQDLPALANADASHLKEAAPTYTITFDANGGTEVADESDVPAGSIISEPTEPTKTGYTFNGWYKEEALTNLWNFDTDTVTADITLYAKWTANTYPVTWVDGQGTTLRTDSVKYGDALPTAPADPTRDGYTFNGWSTTPATMPAEPVTITAQWTAIEYSVKYYDGTSEYTELAATLNYNQRPVKPADQAKHGHDFAGWYADEALSILYDFTAGITADTTIYAKFTPKSYTITWVDGQGGTLQTDSVKYGDTFPTAPAVTPRHGYEHSGWSPTIPETVDSDLTLTAQWDAWTYTVKFFANDGTDTNTTQEITYGTNTFLSANTFTNGEKIFLGWATESTATAALYADKIAADGLVTANGETISLYAVWGDAVAPTHTVTFQIDGTPYLTTPVLDGVKVDEPAAPTKEGHTFAGWCTDETGITSYDFEAPVTTDLTLYANWTVNTYTVTFDANGGTVTPADAEVAYNTPVSAPVAEKAGYTLEGWYASEDFSGTAWDFSVNPVTGTLTLYANWTQIPAAVYTVTFHANNGTTPDIYETASVTAGNTVSAPANNPVWEGHTFAGWFKDVGGTEAYNFADGVTANLDLYANWTVSAGTHKVTFNSNGGSGVAEQHIADGGKVSKPADPQKTGYTFNGWFKEAALTNAWNFDTDTVTAEITLYAKWTENSGSGGTGAGGGGGTPAPSTPSTPSTPTTPTTPEVPDTPKVTDETKEIPTAPENIETLPTGDKVVVVALENTEVIQSVAVPEAVAQANPEASVKVTEGGNAPALPENVAADDVHIVVGISIVDKEGNPVKITESGYFILDADVPAGKKLVVGHYKNGIWVDCLVEDLGNGHYKVHYNGLSPFAAVIIEEHEESPFAAEEKPTEKPAETPAPILGMVLGGLAAAVVLRRK